MREGLLKLVVAVNIGLVVATCPLAAQDRETVATRNVQSQPMRHFLPATERTPALAEWQQLRYGMFIHFGLSTFTQEEYGKKIAPASDYHPTQLDVEQWVRVAKDAGMRYAVLTAKHCTGHCLWRSAYTDFDVEASPVQTDVVGAFVKACRKHGVKPGLYYLLGWDSHHQPTTTPAQYEEFCTNQLAELLQHYGPLTVLWLDIPFDLGPDTAAALPRIYDRIKSLQPDCLVLLNQGFENGTRIRGSAPTYFYKPAGDKTFPIWPTDVTDGERTLPPVAGHESKMKVGDQVYYVPMEVCDTLGENWFWIEGDAPRSVRMLYRLYAAVTARGANLLLDVPPDRSGRIPEASVRCLQELKSIIDNPHALPAPLTLGAKASASNVYHGEAQWGPQFAIDANESTRWATDDGLKEAWLQVDFAQPVTFDAAYLREGWYRTRSYEIQYLVDGQWQTCFAGHEIGDRGTTVRFAPVTSGTVRLLVKEATDGPTLWDFELLNVGR